MVYVLHAELLLSVKKKITQSISGRAARIQKMLVCLGDGLGRDGKELTETGLGFTSDRSVERMAQVIKMMGS